MQAKIHESEPRLNPSTESFYFRFACSLEALRRDGLVRRRSSHLYRKASPAWHFRHWTEGCDPLCGNPRQEGTSCPVFQWACPLPSDCNASKLWLSHSRTLIAEIMFQLINEDILPSSVWSLKQEYVTCCRSWAWLSGGFKLVNGPMHVASKEVWYASFSKDIIAGKKLYLYL